MSELFYIKDRNQTTTYSLHKTTITDYFTSKIEIKPQLIRTGLRRRQDYFTSKIEIKPQLLPFLPPNFRIILHQRSKSNHNSSLFPERPEALFYIKDRNQTTTDCFIRRQNFRLFYIKDRNQTTTVGIDITKILKLFYIKDRNQTTTLREQSITPGLLFYIKDRNQTTTSACDKNLSCELFYIKDRNQTTT